MGEGGSGVGRAAVTRLIGAPSFMPARGHPPPGLNRLTLVVPGVPHGLVKHLDKRTGDGIGIQHTPALCCRVLERKRVVVPASAVAGQGQRAGVARRDQMLQAAECLLRCMASASAALRYAAGGHLVGALGPRAAVVVRQMTRPSCSNTEYRPAAAMDRHLSSCRAQGAAGSGMEPCPAFASRVMKPRQCAPKGGQHVTSHSTLLIPGARRPGAAAHPECVAGAPHAGVDDDVRGL